jgi:Flp pilus assembly protein TadG
MSFVPWRIASRVFRRKRSRGQSLVELALVLPILLVLVAGALDLGRLYYSQITITSAAKEGALEASKNPTLFDNTQGCDAKTNTVICRVLTEANGSFYTIQHSDVTLACSPTPCPAVPAIGDTVTVSVTGHFSLITPLLSVFTGGQNIDITRSAVAQLGVTPVTTSTTTSSTTTSTTTSTTSSSSTTSSTTTTTTTTACGAPDVTGTIGVSPSSGSSKLTGSGTVFTFTPPTVTPQSSCTFVYSWSFGDGTNYTGPTPPGHVYAKKGSGSSKDYTVTLTISNTVLPNWTGSISVVVDP